MKVVQQRAKDSPVWAVVKRCVRGFQRGECQTPQLRFCAGFGGDLGNCSCKQEKGRWVALRPPPVSHRPATPVVQGDADSEGLEILGGLLALPALRLWVEAPNLPGVPGL